jgi:hypothetical protein
MSPEMSSPIQLRLSPDLLPRLGGLAPGPKNALSPFRAPAAQSAAPGKLEAAGLLDAQGRLKPAFQPLLDALANPSALVNLQVASGGRLQQFSLYYPWNGVPPLLLVNTADGLLLEYPADRQAVIDGLLNFSSDSALVSFEIDARLPLEAARALAALLDLHRRAAARAFADLAAPGPISATPAELERWTAACPEDPQWFAALLPPLTTPSGWARSGLERLALYGLCQPAGDGFALAGAALALGSRMILIDTLYSVDIARLDTAGQVALASLTALQAGINDLLQIEYLGDEIAIRSLTPLSFILQLEDILEQGGAVLPDPQPAVAQPATQVAPAPVGAICPHCAQPLSPTARFCSRCGKLVAAQPADVAQTINSSRPFSPAPAVDAAQTLVLAPPVTAQSVGPPPAERLVAVLPMGSQSSGFLGLRAEGFVLALTDQRILVAQQTSALLQENARVAKETAKTSGKGFFGQWGAVIGASGVQRYLQMQPQQILDETPGNYAIPNDQVHRARIQEGYSDEDVRSDVTLNIEAAGGKFTFRYTTVGKQELKQALQQTLGNRVS